MPLCYPCALPSPDPSPLTGRLPRHLPAPHAASEPAPRHSPGIANLRSSAFICGSFFAEAPQINRSIFINVRRARYSSAPEASSSDEWCGKIVNKRISITENKKRN
ncbi:MAG: hypothetical protein OIN66_14290 [Candidatus Methanoperedens sp.]|nr:hypothetical protein [Candidatus Methanoperedens sp.]